MSTSNMDKQQSSPLPRNQSGKSCTNCVRIKCKCVPRAEGTGCERCYRLKKDCVPSGSAKRGDPKPRHVSRSARLEEKLDGLVSLLRAQNLPVTSSKGGTGVRNSETDEPESEEETSPATAFTPASDLVYYDEPSPMEAEESLNRFREYMLPFSPYIHLPPQVTSAQLRDTYPFLWLNIMSVTSKSSKTRASLSDQAKSIIVQRVVAGNERSLDLLYGMLTFVNWVQLCSMDKQFACVVSQLAVAVIWDLGLQMPPPENPMRCVMGARAPTQQQLTRKERTMEELRAVLGTFLITSMSSRNFKSADGLRWTPYFDEYLSSLAQHSTVSQDKVLIAQVKIQLIINQAQSSSWGKSTVDIPLLYVDALQSQLDDIVGINGTSTLFENNSMILELYHFTTLAIHESVMLKPPTPLNEPDLKRYKVYQRCLNSIRTWLDNFFAMPLEIYTSIPCSNYSQLFCVMVWLHKMTKIKDTAWNQDAAREVVDLFPTMDRIIHKFEELKVAISMHYPNNSEDDALSFGLRKFRNLKMIWQSDLASREKMDNSIHEPDMFDGQASLLTFPADYLSFDMLPDTFDFSWQ